MLQRAILLLLLVPSLVLDRPAWAQGASGLPDPISSANLTDLLVRHGGKTLPMDHGHLIAGPTHPVAFKEIRGRLGTDDRTDSIVNVLFTEYREAWSDLQETLVTEWMELPRVTFGPTGQRFPGKRDLDRATSLRHSILDAANRIDRDLLTDLNIVLAGESSIQQEILRRRRTTALEVLKGSSLGGGPSSAARIGSVDLQLIADDTLDSMQRRAVGPLLDEWAHEITLLIEKRARVGIELDRDDQVLEQRMADLFKTTGEGGMDSTTTPSPEEADDIHRKFESLARERVMRLRGVADTAEEWMDRITATLGEKSAMEFRIECEKAAWPQCFKDPRAPIEHFDRAIGLENLDHTTRLAIETLRNEWMAEWIISCRAMVEIGRSRRDLDPMMIERVDFDPAVMTKIQDDRKRIRFDRNELDDRAVRDLKALLSPQLRKLVGDLPEKVPGGIGSGLPFELEDIEFMLEN